MNLSIIIPAYNEEANILEVLNKVKNVDLSNLKVKKEIIVVDDGSKDKTAEIAKNVAGVKVIKKKSNSGKGSAVREGIKFSTGDIILIQDADLEYDPNEYSKIISPILEKHHLVVYGSRFLGVKNKEGFIKKHENAYLFSYLGSRFVTKLTNVFFNSNLTDEATCYKCFRSDVIKQIKIENDRFHWEPEVTAKILKKGIKIHEVPISYNPRSYQEGKKINWVDGLEAIWTLIKYKVRD